MAILFIMRPAGGGVEMGLARRGAKRSAYGGENEECA